MNRHQIRDPFTASATVARVAALEDRVGVEERSRRVWPVYSMPASPLLPTNSFVTTPTASATFVGCWRGRVPVLVGPALDIGVFVYLIAGVQAQLRAKITHPDGTYTSAAVTTLVGADDFHALTATWRHTAAPWRGPVWVDIEARRAAGASDVLVYEPARFIVREPDDATDAPIWTEVVL